MLRLRFDGEGLQVTDEHKNVFIPWVDVDEIRAYRIDRPDGQDGLAISVKTGEWYYELRDDLPDWERHMQRLPRFLPGTLSIRFWRLQVLPVSWQRDLVIDQRQT